MPASMTLADLVVRPDEPIGTSDWIDVTQPQIDAFAALTGDMQWIHTDPVRAAQSPFGTSIAHGFLTLSLLTQLMTSAISVAGASMVVNYGLDKVRFTAPVPAGSRLRARFAVAALTPFSGGVQVTWHVTIENDRARKPCALVDWLVRYYASTPVS
jgi:acyl dehydratase